MSSSFVPRPALPTDIQDALKVNGVPLVSLEDACAGCEKELGEHDVEDYPAGGHGHRYESRTSYLTLGIVCRI